MVAPATMQTQTFTHAGQGDATDEFHLWRQQKFHAKANTQCIRFLSRCIVCYRSLKVGRTTKDSNVSNKYINFTELLQHFVSMQDKHHKHKQAARAMTLLEKSMMTLNT